MTERELRPIPGLAAIAILLVVTGLAAWRFFAFDGVLQTVLSVLVFAAALLSFVGILVVYPNEAQVLTLFGSYLGTVKTPGIWFANPFARRQKISQRVRNFETPRLKVNDNHSNPIEIGAVVVWQVIDTAEALFLVDNYENFVKIQSEAALRGLASSHPYDAHGGEDSLSGNLEAVSGELQVHVQDRLSKAGVKVLETRISHLAYAPEIAQAMLQRQQAGAIIAARSQIVEGAVGMVENALELLAIKGIVHLDDERKAAMVSNLLVVLCSERASQPVVNTGTLYP